MKTSTVSGLPLARTALPIVLTSVIFSCASDVEHSGGANPIAFAQKSAMVAPNSGAVTTTQLRAAFVSEVQREAPEQYRVRIDDVGQMRATNEAHGIEALFEKGRVALEGADGAWAMDLSTDGIGCDDSVEPLPDVMPEGIGNRVEYRRGGVVEWYVNGPLGVEQGFTMAERPACTGPVRIALRLAGDLEADLLDEDGDRHGEAVILRDTLGQSVARVADLFVKDAQGKHVPAWFSVSENGAGISIHIDDAGAAYPLEVDPLIATQLAKLLAPDGQPSDEFGRAVAIDGNTAIIGSPYDDNAKGTDAGAAYIFVQSGGIWSFQAKLIAADGAANDTFGDAVAISGNSAIVGASNKVLSRGAAYVFVRNGSTWTQEARLANNFLGNYYYFGIAVAISGDTVLVGAPGADFGTSIESCGAIYFYTRNAGIWSSPTSFDSPNGILGYSYFGRAVALSGDRAIVGWPIHDHSGFTAAGEADIYVRNAGVWSFQDRLISPSPQNNDHFGAAVGISGTTVVVGSPEDDNAKGTDAGSAFFYEFMGGVWVQQAQLVASDGAADLHLGRSVAVSGNTAVVGAPAKAGGGAVYVYTRDGVVWSQATQLLASDRVIGDNFGGSVAVSSSMALIGALGQDALGIESGAAYVFGLQASAGDACSTASQCASGFCVDGVCCDTACGGGATNDCAVCSVASGASANGVCTLKAAGSTCRASAGLCDAAEVCDGITTACPGDTVAVAGTICRSAAGVCDVAETCDGSSGSCPADDKALMGTPCRAAAGACDAAETCDGTSNGCPADMKIAAGVTCRAPAGACDNAEICNGSSNACPPDAKIAAGITCRMAAGPCDNAETCDGSDNACPADTKVVAGTVCRVAGGPCDAAEVCDGSSNACATDAKLAAGTECRPATGACDIAESCNGGSNLCPADQKSPLGTECRPAAGACDVAELCNGNSGACPVDAKMAAGVECRPSAGACDVSESCDGSGNACPADTTMAAGTECRPSAGPCDIAETCSGTGYTCPADTKKSAGTECRAAAGACDVAETCNGASNACPADQKATAGTECRAVAGECDLAESCNGNSNTCPADTKKSAGTECRAAAGACDVAESCNGGSALCPADQKVAAGTPCRVSAGACDIAESCDGSDDVCPADLKAASGTECRASAGTCDIAESCSGSTNDCPADSASPDGTVCPGGSCQAGACEAGMGGAGGSSSSSSSSSSSGAGGGGGAGGSSSSGGNGGASSSSSGAGGNGGMAGGGSSSSSSGTGGLGETGGSAGSGGGSIGDGSGCGCRIADSDAPPKSALGMLGILFAFVSRRLRRVTHRA